MIAKDIWIIVPFSRPHFANNVVLNFSRQLFKNKKIIIVENGPAIGTFKNLDFKPEAILTSKAHPGAAKNAGIRWIKDNIGNAFWTTFDDDDYYGPKYLNELIDNSDKATIIGKANSFAQTSTGKLRFLDYKTENCFTDMVFGYSISAWTDNTLYFTEADNLRCGEDNNWIDKMCNNGATVWATSRYNSMIIRREKSNHTWAIDDQELVNAVSGPVIEFNINNLDIVNGIIPQPEGKEIPKTLGIYREIHDSFFDKNNFFEFADREIKRILSNN